MLGLWILIAHLAGDYVLQSGWMAVGKLNRWWPAVVHGVVYALPHTLITQSPWALLIIGGTHILIDRYDAACRVAWLKNRLAPRSTWLPWAVVADNYGSGPDTPPGRAFFVKVVIDNTIHLTINAAAILWVG